MSMAFASIGAHARARNFPNIVKKIRWLGALALGLTLSFASAPANATPTSVSVWLPNEFRTADGPLNIIESGTSGPQTIAFGTVCFTPVEIPQGATLTGIGAPFATGGSSGDKVRYAIYYGNAQGTGPGGLAVDAGEALIPTAGGMSVVTFSSALNPGTGGYYWLAAMMKQSTAATIFTSFPFNSISGGTGIAFAPHAITGVPIVSGQVTWVIGQSLCGSLTYGAFPSAAPMSLSTGTFTYLIGVTH